MEISVFCGEKLSVKNCPSNDSVQLVENEQSPIGPDYFYL